MGKRDGKVREGEIGWNSHHLFWLRISLNNSAALLTDDEFLLLNGSGGGEQPAGCGCIKQ